MQTLMSAPQTMEGVLRHAPTLLGHSSVVVGVASSWQMMADSAMVSCKIVCESVQFHI